MASILIGDDSGGATGNSTFSKFLYTDSCTGKTTTARIEPLVGFLHHPYTYCLDEGSFSYARNKSFLTFPFPVEVGNTQLWYFDVGCSLYDSSYTEGNSQAWMVGTYESYGFTFNQILGWESRVFAPTLMWSKVPAVMKPFITYYNIPAVSQPQSSDNPLNHIRTLATPADYVALKVDVDNDAIELELLQQVLTSPDLHALIDEVFWQHHVKYSPMEKYPNWARKVDSQFTLADSFKLLSSLRHKGIRAHAWV